MTKDKLLDIIHGYKRNEISWDSVLTAVEAYSSVSNNGKPLVSGSVCNYCKGKGKIFHWEFGQFVQCGICQTDR